MHCSINSGQSGLKTPKAAAAKKLLIVFLFIWFLQKSVIMVAFIFFVPPVIFGVRTLCRDQLHKQILCVGYRGGNIMGTRKKWM